MAKNTMAVQNGVCLAKRDQVVGIGFQRRVNVKWKFVMHFELFRAAAHFADRMQRKVMLTHGWPVARALSRHGVFALCGID
jgi:hypothetical protein